MQEMIVTAANGDPVRVRKNPSTASETIMRIKCGETVMAGDDTNGWRPITYGDAAGYMMAKFLKKADEPDTFVRTLTTDEYNRLCEARDRIEEALRTLQDIVGVG